MTPGLLKSIVAELNDRLSGGIVSKIYQPNARELVFKIFDGARQHALLVSSHPRFSRIHLTNRKYANPKSPPRFCAFLRKKLSNARVGYVEQVPDERIARIGFIGRLHLQIDWGSLPACCVILLGF